MLTPAVAADLEAACQQTGQDKRQLECDVRFVRPRDVNSVAATVVGTPGTLPTHGPDLYPGSGDLSAFLFLFDLSDPQRAASLNANILDAQRILGKAGPQDRFGVTTSPGSGRGPMPSLDQLAGIGSDSYSVEHSLSSVRPKNAPSSIYLSSIEAIRQLGASPVKRRALLLFTAGRSTGETYTLDDVVFEAQKQRVSVYTFAVAQRASDARSMQPLVQLAERTGGRYFQAEQANPRFAPADLDTVLKHLDNGGRVTVDLNGVTSGQTIELAFAMTGTPSTLFYRTEVQGLTAGSSPSAKQAEPAKSGDTSTTTATPSASTTTPVSTTPSDPSKSPPPALSPGWLEMAGDWIFTNRLFSTFIGIGVLLLLMAFIGWYRASRRRSSPVIAPLSSSHSETSRYRSNIPPTAGADDRSISTPIATLQPAVNGGSPHVVRTSMVTIGRAPDCDIRLSDDTVSAHHATLVHKRDGSFELTDMGSRNGVRVNGERVERRMVANGDKIELGAAQFRFVRN